MKITLEHKFDTDDILSTLNYIEEKEFAEELLEKCSSDAIVNEATSRALLDEVFENSTESEQRALIDSYAESFGYVKEED